MFHRVLKAVAERCSVKRYSQKFYKINRKTPVSEIFFHKVAALRPVNFVKFLRTHFLQNSSGQLFPSGVKLPSHKDYNLSCLSQIHLLVTNKVYLNKSANSLSSWKYLSVSSESMLRKAKCFLYCVHNIVILQIHIYSKMQSLVRKVFLFLFLKAFFQECEPHSQKFFLEIFKTTSQKSFYIVLKQKNANKEMFMQFLETLVRKNILAKKFGTGI